MRGDVLGYVKRVYGETDMGNMSYCRFENTYKDLKDCWENYEDPQDELSESEKKYRRLLTDLCREIAEESLV